MAVSLAESYYTDLTNLSDPLRFLQSMDQSYPAMEYSSNMEMHNTNQPNSEYHGFDHVIGFVDSPPNSKEAWPNQYEKQVQGSSMAEVSNIPEAKKRRMDWDLLEKNFCQESNNQSSMKINNDSREQRNSRNGWPDDIEFEFTGELSNNGLNKTTGNKFKSKKVTVVALAVVPVHETLLSLSSALTALKQEIPSPSGDGIHKKLGNSNSNRQDLVQKSHNLTEGDHKCSSSLSSSNSNELDDINSFTNEQNPAQLIDGGPEIVQNDRINYNNSFPRLLQKKTGEAIGIENCDANGTDVKPDELKFQYVLAAATSIATKSNEDSLTYLNQGQSYEIKLKKLGDLSTFKGKVLKSIIKICFHERRLQYMEREQMYQWQASRPGERIVEVDVPLSYGLCRVSQPTSPQLLNTVEIFWDPMKEVGIYIKVNCISTEFTPKKHGGEKGVPFRIQVETYTNTAATTDAQILPIHAGACQIKVFKLKGADRKHKQDREKIQKRPAAEQEKYQPSYECTILNDIPNESIVSQNCYSPEHIPSTSPVHMSKPEMGSQVPFVPAITNNTIAISNVSSSNSSFKTNEQVMLTPPHTDYDEFNLLITKESTPAVLSQWLTNHRLSSYATTFAQFSGADVLRMTKEDFIQICGLADGIRMFNILHAKAITPRLTIYISFDSSCYHAIYLHSLTMNEFMQKLFKLQGFCERLMAVHPNENNLYNAWNLQSKYSGSGSNICEASKLNVFINGPSSVNVLITDEVLGNIKDDSLFNLEIHANKILMKAVYKNEIN